MEVARIYGTPKVHSLKMGIGVALLPVSVMFFCNMLPGQFMRTEPSKHWSDIIWYYGLDGVFLPKRLANTIEHKTDIILGKYKENQRSIQEQKSKAKKKDRNRIIFTDC